MFYCKNKYIVDYELLIAQVKSKKMVKHELWLKTQLKNVCLL